MNLEGYTARDIALCMERALWQSIQITHRLNGNNPYYLKTHRACQKMAKRLGISWKKVMGEHPIQNDWESPPTELWEKVAHPDLLVDDMMSI